MLLLRGRGSEIDREHRADDDQHDSNPLISFKRLLQHFSGQNGIHHQGDRTVMEMIYKQTQLRLVEMEYSINSNTGGELESIGRRD